MVNTDNSMEEPEYLKNMDKEVQIRKERESTRHELRMTQAQKSIFQMKSKQKQLSSLLQATGGVPLSGMNKGLSQPTNLRSGDI